MQHPPRASSCQPLGSQPLVRLICSSLSDGHHRPQPSPADTVGSAKPAAASVTNNPGGASTAEPNLSQATAGRPVPRAASVYKGARVQELSRVTGQLLAAAALPDSILKRGFHRAISNCSSPTQHDTKQQANTGRSARLHRRNSRQGSTPKHEASGLSPPAFTDLVQPTHHHCSEDTLALRSVTCWSFTGHSPDGPSS